MSENNEDYRVVFALGESFFEDGKASNEDLRKAEQCFRRVIELKPDIEPNFRKQIQCIFNCFYIYGTLGEYENAIDFIKELRKIYPDTYVLHEKKLKKTYPNLFEKLKKYESFVLLEKQKPEKYPDIIEDLMKLDDELDKEFEGIRSDDEEPTINIEGHDVNLKDARLWFSIGEALLEDGKASNENLRKAEENFRKGLELKPREIPILYRCLFIYEKLGEYEKSIECAKEIIEIDPEAGKDMQAYIERIKKLAGTESVKKPVSSTQVQKDTKFCIYCGKNIKRSSNFCINCGREQPHK